MKKLLVLSLTVVALGLFAIGCDTKPIAPKAPATPPTDTAAPADGAAPAKDAPADEEK